MSPKKLSQKFSINQSSADNFFEPEYFPLEKKTGPVRFKPPTLAIPSVLVMLLLDPVCRRLEKKQIHCKQNLHLTFISS